jgi:hypothetical protein
MRALLGAGAACSAGALAWSCAEGQPVETAGPPRTTGTGGSGTGASSGAGASAGAADGQAGGGASSGGTAGATDGGGEPDTLGGPDAPGNSKQCGVCYKDTDCASGFKCVSSPWGDTFCAADCSTVACPAGFECASLSAYPPPAIDGGAADASGSGTGKACVPAKGDSCPCDVVREGVKRHCYTSNTHGSCQGTQKCAGGVWSPCDAPLAEKEVCDGKDNNCNGAVDMLEPGITATALCGGAQAPPHTSFTCVSAKCQISGCDKGWTKFPPTLPDSAGCACAIDPDDIAPLDNGDCTKATDHGDVADQPSGSVTIQGTLSSANDVDWHGVQAKDVDEKPNPNSFRVHVEFSLQDGNPGDEFRFDVLRGDTGGACPGSGTKADLTSYDWCADNTTDPTKPANGDQGASFRIKVHRKQGATPTCNPYKVVVTNGGSGACPSSDPCGSN